MFKVYHGLTFGAGFDPDSEHTSPAEALTEAKTQSVGCVVLQQSDDCFTLIYIVNNGQVYNCLTGK